MSREIRFTKMHGAANDYIYIDATQNGPDLSADEIRRLSDRRRGVGGDGVVFIAQPQNATADLRMQMHNADGSEGRMCGNALRCVAKYALDRGLTNKNPLVIETRDGDKTVHCHMEKGVVTLARVDMGPPRLAPADVPMLVEGERAIDLNFATIAPEIAADPSLRCTGVSMGNSHVVFFVDELTDALVLGLGPKIETSALFPDRVNVEFARVDNETEITMRVWERGSGETHACGTGACATAVAGVLTGRTGRDVIVHLRGGDLRIEWPDDGTPVKGSLKKSDSEKGRVFMTGPAEFAFDGTCIL